MKNNVGIILPGDPKVFESLSIDKRKLHGLFVEFEKENINAQLFVYSDDYKSEIEKKLMEMQIVLVWVNPIENGKDRSVLEDMLLHVAEQKIFVSAHPDIILKIGTKEVLLKTNSLDWGSDIEVYKTKEELQKKLVKKLFSGMTRVLKQNRGNGGNGVWRVDYSKNNPLDNNNPYIRVFHALRNSKEEEMLFTQFLEKIKEYFDDAGQIIDQEFILPEPKGMIRIYMTQDKVVGFGHQYVKALVRPKDPPDILETPPRIYYSKDRPEYQELRLKMENDWILQLQKMLDIEKRDLPIIWDADFLYRPKQNTLMSKYVLCEINVSSVYPFPEYAVPDIIQAVKEILNEKRI